MDEGASGRNRGRRENMGQTLLRGQIFLSRFDEAAVGRCGPGLGRPVFQRSRIQEILSQTGPYRIRSRSFYQDSGAPEDQKMPD